MKQELMGWQWHRLDNVQIICTLLQTDKPRQHLNTQFLQARCSSWCPTNSVEALKAIHTWVSDQIKCCPTYVQWCIAV